jgi:hypothetical protein
MYSLAAHPDSLGGPWQPLGGLAYTLPALTALAGFWRPAFPIVSRPWHNRNTLKGIGRGLPLCFTLTLQRGFTPTRYPRPPLGYGN